ncbi:MAG: hypothetical protein AB8H86_05495 [Polyangiales bacterium]
MQYGFLTAFLWLLVSSAVAQEAPHEADGEQTAGAENEAETEAPGSAAYFRGLEAADEQRWDDALSAFQESFQASNRTPLLLNIAVAQQALARYVTAAESLDMLQERDDVDAATFRAAEALRRELDARIAVLVIERPEGSALRVDALPAESNRVSVNPGPHVIAVEQDGFLSFRREVEAEPGQVHRIEVQLMARETIEIDPRRRRRRILGVVLSAAVVTAGAVLLGVLLGGSNTATVPSCPPQDLCFQVRP